MKSRRHKEKRRGKKDWDELGFLNCGRKFSHVGASFQLAHSFDTMKSRRHKAVTGA